MYCKVTCSYVFSPSSFTFLHRLDATFEFDSNIVSELSWQNFDSPRVYFAQGADNVIFERLADGNDELKRATREHLEQFGSAGLRTLCLAYRDLNPEMYESWNEKFIQAKSSLRDREKKLDEVYALSLILLFIHRRSMHKVVI